MTTSLTRTGETKALAKLASEELARAVGGIAGMHRAISDRAFGAAPPTPAKLVHDAVCGGIYGAIRGGTRALGAASSVLPERPVSCAPRGAFGVAVLNGLIGDALERENSPLAQPMGVRLGGHLVDLTPAALAAAFPDAEPRVVVFLHGLMETERSWALGGRPTYGDRLAAELGLTPVHLRYNTGRHISENGRTLSELLSVLCANWPVDVDEIALVGHSMGGLVSRSACHIASVEGHGWVRHVRHVVTLGSPHMGAPLEQLVHQACAALDMLPETRALSSFLRRRSSGIRDLRHGSLVDEDWDGRDPEALRAAACAEVPLLEGATHCFITATVTRSPEHPLGRLIGDALVLQPSGSGRSRKRSIGFRDEHGHHVGGANHIALLNHPDVYAKLREWLSTPTPRIDDRRRRALSR